MKAFKYSVNTNALKKDMEPRAIVALAVEIGLDGIEWGIRSMETAGDEMREMADRTRDAGLEVVNWLIGGKPWYPDDLKRRVDWVAAVGGKSMRVDHPWVAWNLDESLHQRDSIKAIFRLARDAMPALEELSRRSGVRFLFETHAGALMASPLMAAQCLDGCSPEAVGVIYDPANTTIEGSLRPRSEVEVLGAHLAYVHAKNHACYFDGEMADAPVRRTAWKHKSVAPDAGMLDWVEVFFALKLGGFSGYISSEEYFSPGRLDTLKAGVAFLKACEAAAPDRTQEPFTRFNVLSGC